MTSRNQFIIRNELPKYLILNIEPEGVHFSLGSGDEVSVTDVFETHPVTVQLASTATGDTIVSIWPGDGQVRVRRMRVDVLDLKQG